MIEHEAGEVKIRGTIAGYEKFISGNIWRDLTATLKDLYNYAGDEYKDATNMEQVAKIQGRQEAIEYVLGLPQQILDELNNTYGEKINEED